MAGLRHWLLWSLWLHAACNGDHCYRRTFRSYTERHTWLCFTAVYCRIGERSSYFILLSGRSLYP